MTYGEYYYLVKSDMKLKDGVWITNRPNITIPLRMSKKEAVIYYNSKFRRYWASIKKQIGEGIINLTKKQLNLIPIFSQLNSSEIENLQSISFFKSLQNNEVLFFEGDDSLNLYMIVDGSIEIYKTDINAKQITLKRFSPFSFVAEVSNYNNMKFPATAKSIDNTTVLVIDYKKFEKQFLYHPTIIPTILKSITNKVVLLEKIISENLIMNATQRVSKFIYEEETLFQNSKHHEIANRLNITAVTFSRILKKLRTNNIITSNNQVIDKELLKKEFS